MPNHTLSLLYTTVSNTAEAEQLAQLVLHEKLAMCVNILPQGQSLYLWEGSIESNTECYLLFKTTHQHIEPLMKLIKEHHSYENPALLYWEAGASKAFFDYISMP